MFRIRIVKSAICRVTTPYTRITHVMTKQDAKQNGMMRNLHLIIFIAVLVVALVLLWLQNTQHSTLQSPTNVQQSSATPVAGRVDRTALLSLGYTREQAAAADGEWMAAAASSQKKAEPGTTAAAMTAAAGDSTAETVRVVCIGDTHGRFPDSMPEGEVLIHTGDFSMFGNTEDITNFNEFLRKLPYRHKLVISGNHDPEGGQMGSAPSLPRVRSLLTHATHYLEDEAVTLEVGQRSNLTVYGSPWQPQFPGFATYASEPDCLARWDKTIPEGVDVLMTHTPPHGYLDNEVGLGLEEAAGSTALLRMLARRKPMLACFGHIHYPGGQSLVANLSALPTPASVLEAEEGADSPHVRRATRGGGATVLANVAMAADKPIDGKTGRYPWRRGAKPVVVELELT